MASSFSPPYFTYCPHEQKKPDDDNNNKNDNNNNTPSSETFVRADQFQFLGDPHYLDAMLPPQRRLAIYQKRGNLSCAAMSDERVASNGMHMYLGSDDEAFLTDPPKDIQSTSHIPSFAEYLRMYEQSVNDPDTFWGDMAKNELHFKELWTPGKFVEANLDIRKGPVSIKWMQGAVLNVCYNCVDRHVDAGNGNRVAFFWEGNDPDDTQTITYSQLLAKVCKLANVLKSLGVKKGDRVAVYLPMIVELAVVVLACARIGAVHSVVFGGFSAESLGARIVDGDAKVLVTADGVWRGKKLLKLKKIADEAIDIAAKLGKPVRNCVVVRHLGTEETNAGNAANGDTSPVELQEGKRPHSSLNVSLNAIDVWYDEQMNKASDVCEPEWMQAEDPLFMLYTSGSTGKPKGVLHTQAGYLLYVYSTFKYVFDYHQDDIFWCTADIGWITGHSYIVYGPLANGATGILFEGTPFHPDAGRFWDVVDKYRVTQFYTAPTAIRALMKYGDEFVTRSSRSSLRILGTVGEPINPEAWKWYHFVVGQQKCAIVDTYWQTETGGHIITPLPGATTTKPGSACFPFFGIRPVLLTDRGEEIEGPGEGALAVKGPWPGMMRTVYGDHTRFETTYFTKFPGYYCTGDGCRRDDDGYYWITGRTDDMMNVSGHLLSTAEIESALVSCAAVAEAAVVAAPDCVKGQVPYAFITLKMGQEYNEQLLDVLKAQVRKKIGPLAVPGIFQPAPGLPKTRSGKIMRRVLRRIASNDTDLGDLTTMADETVINDLWSSKPKGTSG